MEDKMYYLIKDLGFPIVMCMYFMVINNRTIRHNTDALVKLKEIIITKM